MKQIYTEPTILVEDLAVESGIAASLDPNSPDVWSDGTNDWFVTE